MLRDLFPSKKGPHGVALELRGKGKEFDMAIAYATELIEEVESKKAEGHVVVDTTIIDQADKEKKRARTEKARLALASRKDEAAKRRRTDIS